MGLKRLSKNDIVAVSQEDILQLDAVIRDYRGTSGTDACTKVNRLIRQIRKLIPVVESEQRETLFWKITYTEWYGWMTQDLKNRSEPALLCTEFDDPARAEEFLVCPPLSEEKCGRLFAGIDKPSNAYEEYVARARHSARQNEIMFHEKGGPHWRVIYRLRVLTGCTERHVKKCLEARNGFALLDAINDCSNEAVADGIEMSLSLKERIQKISQISTCLSNS